ncbi:MAG TPA: hypothetical protein VGG64_14965 [Pirellulales bacterium]
MNLEFNSNCKPIKILVYLRALLCWQLGEMHHYDPYGKLAQSVRPTKSLIVVINSTTKE